jgi:hypothetical protein
MGMTLGAVMGSFIVYLKVQPFIATLAGMWFARGMCFFISDNAININNPIFKILGQTKILIPGVERACRSDRGVKPALHLHPGGCGLPAVDCRLSYIATTPVLAAPSTPSAATKAVRPPDGPAGRPDQGAGLHPQRVLLCDGRACLQLFVSSGHGLYAPASNWM